MSYCVAKASVWTGVVVAALLAAGSMTAWASGRKENWKRVETLAPGALIEVESVGQPPDQCRVVSADDTSLTCARDPDPNIDWRTGDNARVVFPRNAVRTVWIWQDVSYRRPLIRMGLGFAIGALICSEGGPVPAFICAGIGALIVLRSRRSRSPGHAIPYSVSLRPAIPLPGPIGTADWSIARLPLLRPDLDRLVRESKGKGEDAMPRELDWTDTEEIGIQLQEMFPDTDPYSVRFTDLHKWVVQLPAFKGDPMKSNEGILEAIQTAWHEEYEDAKG